MKHQSDLQPPMRYSDAVEQCAKLGGFIKTRLSSQPQNEATKPNDLLPLVFQWTGTRRFNLTHFRREDGFLFEAGFGKNFFLSILIEKNDPKQFRFLKILK